ncbi:MAG: hypothetical protein AAF763_02445 [Pseudomonadota bacterium]
MKKVHVNLYGAMFVWLEADEESGMPTVTYADDLAQPQFFLSDVARAAQMNPNTLKTWINRGLIVMQNGDREAAGFGTRRLFSLRRIYQAAITARLVDLGIGADAAARAALRFTDLAGDMADGSEDFHWGGEEPDVSSLRVPGELFSSGTTYLVISRSPHEPDATIELVAVADQTIREEARYAAVLLNLNEIVETVRISLGLPVQSQAA